VTGDHQFQIVQGTQYLTTHNYVLCPQNFWYTRDNRKVLYQRRFG
jgi:hypothetical protein